MLERTVRALEAELVKANTEAERAQLDRDALQEAQRRLAEAREREDALLELLGEKEEALEEMRMDVTDMRGIYKEQVVELVERVNQLEQEKLTLFDEYNERQMNNE